MRVPSIGQDLDERRIVREGKLIAERMLNGYSVTANGRFIPTSSERGTDKLAGALHRLGGVYQRMARSPK